MCSSDSDEELVSQFREAIDHEFINDIVIKANSEKEKAIPSLRPQSLKNCTNELKVTPEFQNYVAKHLDKIIKRQIKEVSDAKMTCSSRENEPRGIKMFSNSTIFVNSRDLEPVLECRNRSKRKKMKLQRSVSEQLSGSEESVDELERLSAAAVSPEWVLTKEGAYGKCCEKGKVIRLLDLGRGHLVECTDDSQNERKQKIFSSSDQTNVDVISSKRRLLNSHNSAKRVTNQTIKIMNRGKLH